MSLEKVRDYLKQYNMENQILEFNISSATVREAAIAVGCNENEIAKTLSFIVDEKPILIVVAGDCKIDNTKFKQYFNTKAKMIPFENVEKLIGHAVGGVCPFGVYPEVTTYLDESLKRFKYVYPACGNSNSAIKLTIPELEKTSNYSKWIDVSKIIE